MTSPTGLYLVPRRTVPRASHVPAGRALHLIDIENLMGGPERGPAAMHWAFECYRKAAGVGPHDHFFVAVNPGLAVEAAALWQAGLLRLGYGPDGADKALMGEVGNVERIASLYDRIMIGSGDGIFCEVAEAFTSIGITVGVVSGAQSLAYRLAQASTFVRYLDYSPLFGDAA